MPELSTTVFPQVRYADLMSYIENDQGDDYLASIGYVLSVGTTAEEVLCEIREQHGILPFPTQTRQLSTDVMVAFWKLLELHSLDYKKISEDDLMEIPVNEWPAVPVGTVGPLVIMGHCCPPSKNCMGIDPDACPQVWLSPKIYYGYLIATLEYLQQREVRPRLYRAPPKKVSELKEELEEYDPDDQVFPILRWMLSALPLTNDERALIEESIEDGTLTLPPGYTSAIDFIQRRAPIIDIRELEISNETYERIPKNISDRYKTLCYLETEKELYVAVSKLDDFEVEDQIINRLKLEKDLVMVQGRSTDIINRLERFENVGGLLGSSTSITEDDEALERANKQAIGDVNIVEEACRMINPKSINTTPEELLDWLIFNSVIGKASDIHIEQYREQTRVRARIDGQLTTIFTGPLKLLMPLVAIIKNHCNMTLNTNDAQDGRFSIKFSGRMIDARVSAIPWRKKFQKLTIRLLDKAMNVKSLEDLGLPPVQYKTMATAINRPQGMIVVTGPTGSGKSTTLYAALQSINKPNINVQTIEDPIEYEMEGLNQTQVDPNQDLTFYSVLRRILRADPDVVMVGEIRDKETAVTAAEAALTGHLILSTLHSLDAIRAIGRLLAMDVQPYMLADSLILLHAQRLIRRLCRCRREGPMTPEIEEIYRNEGLFDRKDAIPRRSFYKNGCPECFNTGYRGRLAIMEICPVNDLIRDLIIRKAKTDDFLNAAYEIGYEPMIQVSLMKALSGATSVEECMKLQRM